MNTGRERCKAWKTEAGSRVHRGSVEVTSERGMSRPCSTASRGRGAVVAAAAAAAAAACCCSAGGSRAPPSLHSAMHQATFALGVRVPQRGRLGGGSCCSGCRPEHSTAKESCRQATSAVSQASLASNSTWWERVEGVEEGGEAPAADRQAGNTLPSSALWAACPASSASSASRSTQRKALRPYRHSAAAMAVLPVAASTARARDLYQAARK